MPQRARWLALAPGARSRRTVAAFYAIHARMTDRDTKIRDVLHAAAAELREIDRDFCGLAAVVIYSDGERDEDGLWLRPVAFIETRLDKAKFIEASIDALEDL